MEKMIQNVFIAAMILVIIMLGLVAFLDDSNENTMSTIFADSHTEIWFG